MIKIVLVTLLVISTIFCVQSAAVDTQEPIKDAIQDAPAEADASPTKMPEPIGMTSSEPPFEEVPVAISPAALASLGGK